MTRFSKYHSKHYLDEFSAQVIVNSPGRINLIGEHIDYSGGTVLPAAIENAITLHFKINQTNECNVFSINYKSGFCMDLKTIEKSNFEWQNYIRGIVFLIEQLKPNFIKGFDCIIDSNLPIGAGISSSAAMECGIAHGLNELFEIGLSKPEIVQLCMTAEHEFVGNKCGIMDQFAVVMGKKEKIIKLNCETLEYQYLKANFSPYKILLLNTNLTHNLASSEYNTRRKECEIGLKIIQQKHLHVKTLSEVTEKMICSLKAKFSYNVMKRLKYVVDENDRVNKACTALAKDDLVTFGKLLYHSHEGLRDLYNVSCEELDFLVDYAKNTNGIIGSRMMGGGFGGCTINLLHKDIEEEYIQKVSKAYLKKHHTELTPISVSIGDGVKTQYNESNN